MSATEAFAYDYTFNSLLKQSDKKEVLFLANYSEVPKSNLPCFFQGSISNPYIVARCLVNLANVVKSNFIITQAQLEAMRDPIVTAMPMK